MSEDVPYALKKNFFKPGQSGNPGGSRAGVRKKIQTGFLNELLSDWERCGAEALRQARLRDPVAYIKVVAGLLPNQVEASKPLDELSDGELVAGIAFLRARLTGSSGESAIPALESQPTH